ncbi:YwqG family protein [Streptomyces sp. NPDC052396]|uniref:YwqG family protein n=1 Tax=Streptomyces sp. NPDC052396 TaxID=3365689 RepID=UPI0037CF9E18
MYLGSAEELSDHAHRYLPAAAAEQWLGLLRPAAQLTRPAEGEPVAAQLGGLPRLPQDMDWPVWEGHGPLSFIASVDCAALPSLDIPLPKDGTLSFFYFDGQADGYQAGVSIHAPDTWGGARVFHVPATIPVTERSAPRELKPFPAVPLAIRLRSVGPDEYHPRMYDCEELPVDTEEFWEEMAEVGEGSGHRIGGYPDPVQDAVEFDAARATSGPNANLVAEARQWVLLAQFDSDDEAGMMWGDCGSLYWVIRREDLAQGRFDRALFEWQSS